MHQACPEALVGTACQEANEEGPGPHREEQGEA